MMMLKPFVVVGIVLAVLGNILLCFCHKNRTLHYIGMSLNTSGLTIAAIFLYHMD